MKPDDSFASDFAPLAASADSSCLGVDGIGLSPGGGEERAGSDRRGNRLSSVPRRNSGGQVESLDESQDVPLIMRLEEVKS